MWHWEKNWAMLFKSPLKPPGSLTMFGFNAPYGPGSSLVRSHGLGGSGGFGGDRWRGAAHLLGMTGGAGGCGGTGGCSWFRA